MGKFSIFSHGVEPGMEGLRRTEIEGTEREADRSARLLEVLGQQIDGVVSQDGTQRQVSRQSGQSRRQGGK